MEIVKSVTENPLAATLIASFIGGMVHNFVVIKLLERDVSRISDSVKILDTERIGAATMKVQLEQIQKDIAEIKDALKSKAS